MTTGNISSSGPLPRLIKATELAQLSPELYDVYKIGIAEEEYDDEEDDKEETPDDTTVLFFEGDTQLSEEQYNNLKKEFGHYTPLVINGSLNLSGGFNSIAFINGDLRCETFHYRGSFHIKGKIYARYYAVFMAEDHEMLHSIAALRLETPYIFSWFYYLANVTVPAHTITFILCDYSDYKSMELTNPHFFWQDDVFVLQPDCCYTVGARYSDAPYWNFDAINKILKAGKSPFIEGFDINSLAICQQAVEHFGLKQYPEAFALYRQATEQSPAYYFAWLQAGSALFQAGAFEQSLYYFEKASSLFPQKQKDLNNRAADFAALACVRLRRLDEAVKWATFSIESSVNNQHDRNQLYFAWRIRGEALLLKGELEKAKTDLERSVEMAWANGSANWLLGLAYYQLGNTKKAQQYHQAAQKAGDKFNTDYTNHQDADFVYAAPITADWLEQPVVIKEIVKDEAYWKGYLLRKGYDEFHKIPKDMLNPEFCYWAADNYPDETIFIAYDFPGNAFTPDLAVLLMARSVANLKYIPKALINKELLLQATKGWLELEHVPETLWDYELCSWAVALTSNLDQLPQHLLDYNLYLKAVQFHSNALDKVPGKLLDDQLYLTALAYGDTWDINNRFPGKYLSTEMLCRAIDINPLIIEHIPGRLVDKEVFAYAWKKYPDQKAFGQLAYEHGVNFRQFRSSASCAEHCWQVYWDEQLILREITSDGYHLFPYEIPQHLYTQGIADAAFRCDPIHLRYIPRRFITPAMADSFARQFADMLHDIPLELRSETVCRIAGLNSSDGGKYFAAVPLPLRTIKACIVALKHNVENTDLIPNDAIYAVFDKLISEDDGTFATEWLHNERGVGALLLQPPQYDKAHSDFDLVIADPTGSFDEEDILNARFYKAWAYHLAGDIAAREQALQHITPDRNDPVETFSVPEPMEVHDFAESEFNELMTAATNLAGRLDHSNAWELVQQAERLLQQAGHTDHHLWAYVLDHKRYLSYELGRFDENETICHNIIDRLQPVHTWPYIEADNIIRAALRAAYNLLAWNLSKQPFTAETLQQAVNYTERSFHASPIESETVLYQFYETRARVYLRATAMDEQYKEKMTNALQAIKEKKLQEQGLVTDKYVLGHL